MTRMVTLQEAQKLQTSLQTEAQVTIKQLVGRHHLPAVKALDACVHDELPEDKKSSLLVRSDLYFKSLLAGWTGVLLGAMKKKDLIGKVAVLKVENWRIARGMAYVTYPDPDGEASALCGDCTIGIFQSLCALQAYKGNGLAQELLSAAKTWAKDLRCDHLFAQVGKKNVCSSIEFGKQGFEIYAGWEGRDHGRYLMRSYTEAAEQTKTAGSFSIEKAKVYPDGAASENFIPLVDAHLAAGRRVRLNAARCTEKELHFDLV